MDEIRAPLQRPRDGGARVGTVGVRWVGPDIVDVLPSARVVPVDSLR